MSEPRTPGNTSRRVLVATSDKTIATYTLDAKVVGNKVETTISKPPLGTD